MKAPASGFNLDRGLRALRGRKRALLVMHDNPDPDSLAGAEGMRLLFAKKLRVQSTLALGGIIGRAENRALVDVLHLELVPMEQIDPSAFDLIALIDTQPGAGNNSLPSGVQAHVVIDHHPLRGPHPGVLWEDIRSTMGASSTIVYEYL